MKKQRSISMIFVVDTLAALVLTFYALVTLATFTPKAKPPKIETLGQYAIVMTWPYTSTDDVDLYVQDPQGNISFFSNLTVPGSMTLEGDDLGFSAFHTKVGNKLVNIERTIIKQTHPGEYVVNAQMFAKRDKGRTPVSIQLWRLAGSDQLITSATFPLSNYGDQHTAFRFVLNGQGFVTSINHLPKDLVGMSKR